MVPTDARRDAIGSQYVEKTQDLDRRRCFVCALTLLFATNASASFPFHLLTVVAATSGKSYDERR